MRQASPYRSASWIVPGPDQHQRPSDRHRRRRQATASAASTPATRRAACGRPTTTARRGRRSSSTCRRRASATSPSRRRNPDIVWVGTGEANIFRASMAGRRHLQVDRRGPHVAAHGAHRHADDRAHHRASDQSRHRVRRRLRPRVDRQRRCAACSRRPTAAGRGRRSIIKSPRTGAIDLVMDPRDPNTLYAAMWQRIRRKWSDPRVEPGYNEGGIVKTTDGGKHLDRRRARACRRREFRGRIGIDISRSNPDTLYALRRQLRDRPRAAAGRRATRTAARCRPAKASSRAPTSIDRTMRGKTWRQTSRYDEATTNYLDNHSGTYGWVFGQIRVDPKDENTIYTHGSRTERLARRRARRSRRVGGHARRSPRPVDRSGEHVHPLQQQRRRLLSVERRRQDVEVRGVGRRRAVLQRRARHEHAVLGVRIDSGSRQPSRAASTSARAVDALAPVAFENAPGGEGSNHAIDPTNPNIVYSHGFYGNFSAHRSRRTPKRRAAGRARRRDDIQPKDPDAELRAQWMAPFIISPHDGSIVYAGYQFLFRSTQSRRQLGEDQPRPDRQRPAADGREPERDSVSDDRRDRRVAEEEGPALRRHRRRPAAHDDRRRQGVDGAHGASCRCAVGSRAWCRRCTPRRRSTSRSAAAKTTTSRAYIYKSTDFGKTFTSIAGEHSGRAGQRDSRGSAQPERALRRARTSASTSRRTAASAGRCSAATCRRCRCPICSSRSATT